jgi:hypothetical protein
VKKLKAWSHLAGLVHRMMNGHEKCISGSIRRLYGGYTVVFRHSPVISGGLRWTSVIVRPSFEHVENLDGHAPKCYTLDVHWLYVGVRFITVLCVPHPFLIRSQRKMFVPSPVIIVMPKSDRILSKINISRTEALRVMI